jgi:serine/threonine protein kinase
MTPNQDAPVRAVPTPGADASSVSHEPHPTVQAPSFAEKLSSVKPFLIEPGQSYGDFVLLRVLGKGAFATVYLAKQQSLGRQVALKISPNRGHEAQTLASLEHDHIVQVFSETIDHPRMVRLLCMQYVSGSTLHEVMQELTPEVRHRGSGRDYLAVIDRVSRHGEEFRPTALQERETLAAGDFFEAVCWTAARLAGALDFAHRQGVLHRDIKPANILINAYGRPFLADFNLATLPTSEGDTLFGGTLAYMAPEHLRAFKSRQAADLDAVDARSDLYSLGVVLYELLTRVRPFGDPLDWISEGGDFIEDAITKRQKPLASLTTQNPAVPASLDAIIRTCLAPRPADRFQTAGELQRAFETCAQGLRAMKQLPPPPPWADRLHRRPFAALLLLSLIPNLLGTAVNIAYNYLHIVSHLSPRQRQAFDTTVFVYNSFAYPILVGITCWLLWKGAGAWRHLRDGHLVRPEELRRVRKQFNFLATWSIVGTSLGWIPGGPAFALAIHWGAEPLAAESIAHFIISFTLSGLIAVVYCYLGTQYVVLRVFWPGLQLLPEQGDDDSAKELSTLPARLALFQIFAGVIPLAGALLLLLTRSLDLHEEWGFRFLIATLIVLGMFGFVLALKVCQYLQRVVQCFTRAV